MQACRTPSHAGRARARQNSSRVYGYNTLLNIKQDTAVPNGIPTSIALLLKHDSKSKLYTYVNCFELKQDFIVGWCQIIFNDCGGFAIVRDFGDAREVGLGFAQDVHGGGGGGRDKLCNVSLRDFCVRL
jgi:hypothetical protein